jgi:hypothetical protein
MVAALNHYNKKTACRMADIAAVADIELRTPDYE